MFSGSVALLPFLLSSEETGLVPIGGEVEEIHTDPTDSGICFLRRGWVSATAKTHSKYILCHFFILLICHTERLVTSTSEL